MKITEIVLQPLTIAKITALKKLIRARKVREEVEALAEITGYEKELIYRLDTSDFARIKNLIYEQIAFDFPPQKEVGEYELVDISKACVAWQMDIEQVLAMQENNAEKDLLITCCMYKKKGEHYADGDLEEKRKFFSEQPISIYFGLMNYLKKKGEAMSKLERLINQQSQNYTLN